MNRKLLITGGVANAAFVLFHVWLGWKVHHWTQVPAGLRGLIEIFNLGGTLFIAFFAYASLALRREMVETRLGRSVSVLAVLLYGTRAASEFIFAAVAQPWIVAVCGAMAAIYLAVLLLPAGRVADSIVITPLATKDSHAAGA